MEVVAVGENNALRHRQVRAGQGTVVTMSVAPTLQLPIVGQDCGGRPRLICCRVCSGTRVVCAVTSRPSVWTPWRASSTASPSMTKIPPNLTAVLTSEKACSIGRADWDGAFLLATPILCSAWKVGRANLIRLLWARQKSGPGIDGGNEALQR